MEERVLRILEFNKVRAMLAEQASFSAGRAMCECLSPLDDLGDVHLAQAETSEARAALRLHQSVPFGGITDVREPAARAAIGVVLTPGELLAVADMLAGSRRLKKFMSDLGSDFPLLRALAGRIAVHTELESRIGRAITEAAEVRDDASPELARIRRALRVTQSRIRDRLESLIRSQEALRYLQEPIITVRNGRFVVPVKAEARSMLPGIIHDQSGSGATFFVEPMVSVEANNELRRLELEERDEIERILIALSAMVGEHKNDIRDTVDTLARSDFVFAKARLSLRMEGNEPHVTGDFKIDIRQARHPLLKGEVVPVDVRLGQDFDTLVITGPNTGGKTVTLKTVGLLVLMAQSGLHIPASGGSRVSVFDRVFSDIGDEQSIEQSLSTFSSHMRNIVHIVEEAGEGSLVLLDEIGAGTDPEEGSRLAMALLEYMHASRARTIATTHYSELKSFAYLRDRVENASVEFDVESLRPTFRLSIGLPGRSNAFEISRRLGLRQEIIDRARAMMSEEHLEIEDLIGQIQASKSAADEEKRRAYLTSLRANELETQYSARLKELKTKEREILDRARQEAQSMIIRVRAQCEEAFKQARRASSSPRDVSRLQQEFRESLRVARTIADSPEETAVAEEPQAALAADEIAPGSPVFVRSVRQNGEVLSPPDAAGNVTVRVGIIRTQVHMSDLASREPEERKALREQVSRLMATKAQQFAPELKIIGMTADEALDALDKYLDDAVLGSIKQVRIIHGKGTGTLRKAVQERLRSHPSVISQRPGGPGEGGDGATIAVLSE